MTYRRELSGLDTGSLGIKPTGKWDLRKLNVLYSKGNHHLYEEATTLTIYTSDGGVWSILYKNFKIKTPKKQKPNLKIWYLIKQSPQEKKYIRLRNIF